MAPARGRPLPGTAVWAAIASARCRGHAGNSLLISSAIRAVSSTVHDALAE